MPISIGVFGVAWVAGFVTLVSPGGPGKAVLLVGRTSADGNPASGAGARRTSSPQKPATKRRRSAPTIERNRQTIESLF